MMVTKILDNNILKQQTPLLSHTQRSIILSLFFDVMTQHVGQDFIQDTLPMKFAQLTTLFTAVLVGALTDYFFFTGRARHYDTNNNYTQFVAQLARVIIHYFSFFIFCSSESEPAKTYTSQIDEEKQRHQVKRVDEVVIKHQSLSNLYYLCHNALTRQYHHHTVWSSFLFFDFTSNCN